MKKAVFAIALFSVLAVASAESNDVHSQQKRASDFLGITEDTDPPYEVFKDLVKNTDAYREFIAILMSFSARNDMQDVVGIAYIAKFFRYYCPTPASKHFSELSLLEQMAVKELFGFPQKVFLEAKKVSACSYPAD